MKPNWDEAPAGAEALLVFESGLEVWVDSDDFDGRPAWRDVRGGGHYFKDRKKMIVFPRPTEWRGPEDGLPPVGAIVEFAREPEDTYFPDDLKGGSSVEILCHYAPAKVKVAVFAYDIDRIGHKGRKVAQAAACCFRLIQTDRDKTLAEMWAIANQHSDYGVGAICGALYDAGWRKRMSRAEAQETLMDLDIFVTGGATGKILDALGFKE